MSTRRSVPDAEKVRNIAVLRFGGLGDYILLLPLLEDLRAHYKNAEITVIAGPAAKEILEASSTMNKLILMPQVSKQGLESVLSLSFWRELISLRRQLPRPIDIFIDAVNKYSFAGSLKPLLAEIAAGPSYRAGLDYRGRAWLCDLRIPEDRYERKHLIGRYVELTRALGCDSHFHLPAIPLPHNTVDMAKAFFEQYRGTPKIALHPGANAKFLKHRAWPVERFAALAEKIMAEETEAQIFITGAKHEEELTEELARRLSKPPVIIPAQDSILAFAAYLHELDFFISNDTGPMHLAVALGVPTLGIFGHADFETYGSYPTHIPFCAVTIDKKVEKTGPNPSEADPRGLLNISADEVHSAFQKLKGFSKEA